MARITVEDCIEFVDNRFALCILATRRARQLAAGAAADTPDPVEKRVQGPPS